VAAKVAEGAEKSSNAKGAEIAEGWAGNRIGRPIPFPASAFSAAFAFKAFYSGL
jgi:hypothetical protein